MWKCLPDHLKFGAFTPEDAKRWLEIISKTSSTCVETSYGNPRFWCQGPPKINKNGAQERSESDLGRKSVVGSQKSVNATPFWVPFGRSWAPFRAALGTKGSQNQEFWHQDAPKSQEMPSRMRHQKQYELLIEFWSENVRF